MKITYFILVTLFFFALIWEHDNQGVAYNPLSERLKLRTNFLAYANGERTTAEISELIKVNFKKVEAEQKTLLKNKLIRI